MANLTPEELYVLLKNIRNVFASGDETQYLVPDEALDAFLLHCSKKIGEAYFRTPRNTVRAFADMLSIIEQNEAIEWKGLIDAGEIQEDKVSDLHELEDSSDELSDFTL